MKIKTMNAHIVHERKPEYDNTRFAALDAAFEELIEELMDAARSNAGFKILLAKQVDSITEIVMGQRETDGEFVTWCCFCKTDYNWGHYFGPEQLLEAMADFMRRCAQ